MKLVIEMDEIMAPKAVRNKCASTNIPLSGNGNKKKNKKKRGRYRGAAHSLCIICKVVKEIEKATVQTEQFRVLKEQVIGKKRRKKLAFILMDFISLQL